MNSLGRAYSKIYSSQGLEDQVKQWKNDGNKIVFTNGCFDLLHRGHIEMLAKTSDLGCKLVVGINSDNSIRVLKGNKRPIIDELSRSLTIASLEFVDAVILFNDETPLDLICNLLPDILCKGGDYNKEDIVGYDMVIKNGGKVITIPLTDGFSSSNIVDKILKSG